MVIKIQRKPHVQFGQAAINTPVGRNLPDVEDLSDELKEYVDIILGREPAPIETVGYLALGELATAYYSRGKEIEMLIHEAERKGVVVRGSQLYQFRTGELRSFLEMAKRAAELGSRRLTQEQLLFEMRHED